MELQLQSSTTFLFLLSNNCANLSTYVKILNRRQIYDKKDLKKRLHARSILLFSFNVLRGGAGESRRLTQPGVQLELSNGTESNYIIHVGMDLLNVLWTDPKESMKRPNDEEKVAMRGLVYGFPQCAGFADGIQQHVFQPKEKYKDRKKARKIEKAKEKELFGEHHIRVFHSTLV